MGTLPGVVFESASRLLADCHDLPRSFRLKAGKADGVRSMCEDEIPSRFAQNRMLTGFRLVLAFQRGSNRGLCNENCQQQ